MAIAGAFGFYEFFSLSASCAVCPEAAEVLQQVLLRDKVITKAGNDATSAVQFASGCVLSPQETVSSFEVGLGRLASPSAPEEVTGVSCTDEGKNVRRRVTKLSQRKALWAQ